MGDLGKAERDAKAALKQDKGAVDQLFLIALEKRDLAAAERFKEEIEKLQYSTRGSRGSQRRLLYYRGYFDLNGGRTAAAIDEFKEALTHRAESWNIDAFEDCLANAYLELRRLDEAIAEYERILKLNPNYPLAHYHLGQAYERKGRQDQARIEYERFLEVWKDADADSPEASAAKKRVRIGMRASPSYYKSLTDPKNAAKLPRIAM